MNCRPPRRKRDSVTNAPVHVKAVLEALRFSGGRREALHSLTDEEWKDILFRWEWVRLTLPLRQVCGDDLPNWVRAEIDSNIADNTERFERIKKDYVEVADALRDASVDHLVLKGFAQWPEYMQGPHLRTQFDIDIFCPPESIFIGRDALSAHGYQWRDGLEPKIVDHLPPLEKQSHYQWRGKLFDPDLPPTVELHFRFWNDVGTRLRPAGLEQFWSRRIERRLDGFTYPALEEVDCLAYSALHVLRSIFLGGLQLYNVYEIAWFLHTNADNGAFWQKRRELHHESLRSLEAVCFRLAQEWFGGRLPEELEREIQCLPTGVHHWFNRYRDSPVAALVRPNKDALWLHLSLLESSSDRQSILWGGFLPLPMRPADPIRRWTPRAYYQYLVHAISRVPHHSRLLPRTLWDGLRWWWSTNRLGKPRPLRIPLWRSR